MGSHSIWMVLASSTRLSNCKCGRARSPDILTRSPSASQKASERQSDPFLVGPKEIIDKARRWRKVLGGGMRQAGILAAAGIYALTYNIERLAEDHNNARALAEGLCEIAELNLDHPPSRQTWFF